jgi:hypothetical protein
VTAEWCDCWRQASFSRRHFTSQQPVVVGVAVLRWPAVASSKYGANPCWRSGHHSQRQGVPVKRATGCTHVVLLHIVCLLQASKLACAALAPSAGYRPLWAPPLPRRWVVWPSLPGPSVPSSAPTSPAQCWAHTTRRDAPVLAVVLGTLLTVACLVHAHVMSGAMASQSVLCDRIDWCLSGAGHTQKSTLVDERAASVSCSSPPKVWPSA